MPTLYHRRHDKLKRSKQVKVRDGVHGTHGVGPIDGRIDTPILSYSPGPYPPLRVYRPGSVNATSSDGKFLAPTATTMYCFPSSI